MNDEIRYARTASSMLDRAELERLLTDVGIAINANDGRCAAIESALLRTTTLIVELLNDLEASC